MHPSSFENMQRCIDWYCPPGARVVDLGAASVNGSYRDLFPAGTAYTGFDLAPGPGVDVVLEDPYVLPLADGSVDLVVSGQMLEHCPQFWRVFTEVARVLAPGGLAFMIAPSEGPIHRYPVDCYRFYPDAWGAMADWAGLRLVHCWRDRRGPWCDLVGVFQKGGTLERRTAPKPAEPILLPAAPHPDPAVEATRGKRPYREVLEEMHRLLAPRLYCEIGVRKGQSLALCRGRAVAIDPSPDIGTLPGTATLHRCTSDDFFFFAGDTPFEGRVDFAFIDGMHLSEFVLRDFMNLERHMSPKGVIVVDDVLPGHPVQALRKRQSQVWTGDVWRFARLLSEIRPDLQLTWLDTAPTGLLVVRGLKPQNRVLWNRYNSEIRKLLDAGDEPVPEDLLTRAHAVDPTAEAIRAAIGR